MNNFSKTTLALAIIGACNVATAAPPSKLHEQAERQRDIDTINHTLDVELARLSRVIEGAIELENAQYELENMKLDAAYKHATLSLADYSTQKNDLLTQHHALVQSLYDSDIALSKSYADREAATK